MNSLYKQNVFQKDFLFSSRIIKIFLVSVFCRTYSCFKFQWKYYKAWVKDSFILFFTFIMFYSNIYIYLHNSICYFNNLTSFNWGSSIRIAESIAFQTGLLSQMSSLPVISHITLIMLFKFFYLIYFPKW